MCVCFMGVLCMYNVGVQWVYLVTVCTLYVYSGRFEET